MTIGLSESTERYASHGYTPARAARNALRFRRYGMPFATEPRARLIASARACRAIVATRLLDPEREIAVHRALQQAWFNTTLLLDVDEDIARALARVAGLDVDAIVAALDDERVAAAYAADREATRSAAGGATEAQGRAANSDGRVRYTAPSLVFELDAPTGDGPGAPAGVRRLEAGGFQPVEAYDLCLANLDPGLDREPPPDDPLPALRRFPDGLVTQEVAAIMAPRNEPPDRDAAESALIELAGEGAVRRIALGDDALWQAAPVAAATDGSSAPADAVAVT